MRAVRLALDDWLKLNLGEGQRILVWLLGRADVWRSVTHVTEMTLVIWITLARRVPVVAVRGARRTRDQVQPESAAAYRPA
ncbi:MAG: hypothetical protein C0467_29280 [Planctomycetaceae bacterium]|nr:hypothetical protein [Planctomycetaceae bacterium]